MVGIPLGRWSNQESLGCSHGDLDTHNIRLTPKRPQSEKAGLADIFPYYAGFSFDWAKAQLRFEGVLEDAVVLDPWNGSGTTTLAARVNGMRSVGVDLNPIANIVAYLRLQEAEHMTTCEVPPARNARASKTEPLLSWFSSGTAGRLRQWTDALDKQSRPTWALGHVALFRVVRLLTKKFEGSNPTWVRRTSGREDLVRVTQKDLDASILQEQRYIKQRLCEESFPVSATSIIRASSTSLPLARDSVDFILSSPPYLTRIDYAVAYSRELALLDVDISKDRSLRSSLMGTTLIRRHNDMNVEVGYGPKADELVQNIAAHDSKASAGYYLKQARQYLDDLALSFDELTRVSKKRAVMRLVVQDSYYKDIPIRLAEICVEEAERRGWSFVEWDQAEVTRLLTQVNTAARAYPKGKVAETVMTLRRNRS